METQAYDDVIRQRRTASSNIIPEKRREKTPERRKDKSPAPEKRKEKTPERRREKSPAPEKRKEKTPERRREKSPAPQKQQEYVEKSGKSERSRRSRQNETVPKKDLYDPNVSRFFEDMDRFTQLMGTIELDDTLAQKIKNTPAMPSPVIQPVVSVPNTQIAYGILNEGTNRKVVYSDWKSVFESELPYIQITTDIMTQPVELYHSKTLCGNNVYMDTSVHVFDGDIVMENIIGRLNTIYVSPMTSLTLENCTIDLTNVRCDGQLTFRNCRLMVRANEKAFQVKSIVFDHCYVKIQSMSPTLTVFECAGNDEFVHSYWTNWEILGERVITICVSNAGRAFFNHNVFTILCPNIQWERNSGSSIFSTRIRSGTAITMSPNVKLMYSYCTPKPDGITN